MTILTICPSEFGDGINYGEGFVGDGPAMSATAQRSNGINVDFEISHQGYGDGIDYGDAMGNGWLSLEDLEEDGDDTIP